MEQNGNPEINPCTYCQPIFNKDAKNIYWNENSVQYIVVAKLDIK